MRLLPVGLCLLCNKLDRQIYERSSRKKVWICPVIFVGILAMIIEIALKRLIANPKMLGKVLSLKEFQGDSA